MCEFVYHFPGVIKLVHKSDLVNPQVRGYEAYTEDIGSKGYYRDDDGTQIVKFRKLALPDCYEAEDGGYLRVPGLNLSKELRLLGDTFKLRCVKEEDGSWSFVSTYKVNAS